MLLREFTVYVNKSEHIKEVIRIRKSNHRQHNGQKKKPYKLIRPYANPALYQMDVPALLYIYAAYGKSSLISNGKE
jgi:hypothetical protein